MEKIDKAEYILNYLHLWGKSTFRDRHLEKIYPVDENSPELIELLRKYCDEVIGEMREAYTSPEIEAIKYSQHKTKKNHEKIQSEIKEKIESLVFHPIEYRNLKKEIDNENEAIKIRHQGLCLLDNATCYGWADQLLIYLEDRVRDRIDLYRKEQASLFSEKEKREKWLEYTFYTEKYISTLITDCYINHSYFEKYKNL